jgi:hypothetical protein
MPTVTLNLPAEKVKPFLNVIQNEGLAQSNPNQENIKTNTPTKQYHSNASNQQDRMIDWDLYHNELEYE